MLQLLADTGPSPAIAGAVNDEAAYGGMPLCVVRIHGYYHVTSLWHGKDEGADSMKNNWFHNTLRCFSGTGACIILACCIFSGCSSSDSSQRNGTFLDSAVEGLTFMTESSSGVTGASGTFSFNPGEEVTFSIGGIVLGTAPARTIMTPVDLVDGAVDERDPTVTNITRTLISLDEDNDPTNGITINPQLADALADISVDFNQDASGFEQDPAVMEMMRIANELYEATGSTERTICSVTEAQEHLGDTLDRLAQDHDGSVDINRSGGSGGGGGGGGCG